MSESFLIKNCKLLDRKGSKDILVENGMCKPEQVDCEYSCTYLSFPDNKSVIYFIEKFNQYILSQRKTPA